MKSRSFSAIIKDNKQQEGENEMIKIAVVDDEREFSDHLKQCLMQYAEKMSLAVDIQTFNDSVMFMERFRSDYDILFLDIEMPDLDGIRLATKIREKDAAVPIIFVTNMKKMAVHGYQVNALDFIVKPIHYYAFELTFKKALRSLAREDVKFIVFSVKSGFRRLNSRDIRFIEVFARKLVVHTDSETFEAYGTLREIEEQLYPYGFRRCNSGYLVNLRFVTGVEKDDVLLNDDRLAISRPRKQIFLKELMSYWGGGAR